MKIAETAARMRWRPELLKRLQRHFPVAARSLAKVNLIFTAAYIAGWEARIIGKLFVLSQIKSKRACLGFLVDVDYKSLKLDWHLLYSPFALESPGKDFELTVGRTWQRTNDGAFRSRRLNLSCDNTGMVQLGHPRDTATVFDRAASFIVSG